MSRSYTPSHRGRRRYGTAIALIAAGAVVVIGGVAGAVTLTGRSHGDASLTSASPSRGWTAPGVAPAAPTYTAVADVTPPVAATDCATPSTFTYSGTLSAAAPGTVKYQWVYSSGQPGPVRTVNFTAAGQHPVAGESVTAKTAGGGWGEIKVLSPAVGISDRAAYKLLCGGSSAGGVTVTAAVTPAARTAACGGGAPTFTAAGSVEASKAETVTYYWAQSSAKDSAPATLTFTGPGKKAAAPLTISPPAASGAGEAVLVVTGPVTAASAPATYTLTCQAPPATATSGPARPASGPSSPASSQSSPAYTTSPAGSPTSQASSPATPPGSPSTPASTPATAQSSPPGNSGGSMYIPDIDNLNATMNVGDSISRGTEVDGGVAPYTWSITGLPPGITQEPQAYGSTAGSGIIGTATVAGTYPITVTVTDSEQPPQTLTEHYTLAVLQPNSEEWSVEYLYPTQATVGTPYSSSLGLAGQTNGLTVTWAVTGGGSLPPGLILNSATGTVTGTPTEPGTFTFSIVATDVATGATKNGGFYDFTVSPAGG
jgi:large repetitive protein